MKQLLIALALITSSLAHADGFRCTTESGLVIKVYNHTDPHEGTRKAAIMIISDANVGLGNKTIASFITEKGVLQSKEQTYTAKVDLRFLESSRKGELIGGTKLGFLQKIILSVNFNYDMPVKNGEKVSGLLILVKRDGERLVEAATCARYLKN